MKTATKTKTPPPRGQKRKDTSTSTKKRKKKKTAATNNNQKKNRVTNKEVINARNKVVLNLEKNLQPIIAKGKRASFTEEEDRMLTKASSLVLTRISRGPILRLQKSKKSIYSQQQDA